MPRTEPHSFSRTFAKEHSVNEAVILKFLAYKVRCSNNKRDKIFWYYDSTEKIQKRIPYISSSAIDANIRKMQEAGLVQIGNYNKLKRDKTRWFHVPQPYFDEVEEDTISFDPDDANNHGITAAVLLHNLRYQLRDNLKTDDANVVHEMSPAYLETKLPFSASTIKATLNKLVQKRVVLKTSETKPEYTLPPDEMLILRTEAKLKK